jgi:hypothetical protein
VSVIDEATGTQIKIPLEPSIRTVGNLKKAVKEATGGKIDPVGSSIALAFGTRRCADDVQTLDELQVTNAVVCQWLTGIYGPRACTFFIPIQARPATFVVFDEATGSRVEMELRSTDTVGQIKKVLRRRRVNVPALVFGTTTLTDDTKTMGQLKVPDMVVAAWLMGVGAQWPHMIRFTIPRRPNPVVVTIIDESSSTRYHSFSISLYLSQSLSIYLDLSICSP